MDFLHWGYAFHLFTIFHYFVLVWWAFDSLDVGSVLGLYVCLFFESLAVFETFLVFGLFLHDLFLNSDFLGLASILIERTEIYAFLLGVMMILWLLSFFPTFGHGVLHGFFEFG